MGHRFLVCYFAVFALLTSLSGHAQTYSQCKRELQSAIAAACPSGITPQTPRLEREKLMKEHKQCKNDHFRSNICVCHYFFDQPISRGVINWNQWEYDHCQSARDDFAESESERTVIKKRLGVKKIQPVKCLGKKDIQRLEARGDSYISPGGCPPALEDTSILVPSEGVDALTEALRTGHIREAQVRAVNTVCDLALHATGTKIVSKSVRTISNVVSGSIKATGAGDCVSFYRGIKRGAVRIVEDTGKAIRSRSEEKIEF